MDLDHLLVPPPSNLMTIMSSQVSECHSLLWTEQLSPRSCSCCFHQASAIKDYRRNISQWNDSKSYQRQDSRVCRHDFHMLLGKGFIEKQSFENLAFSFRIVWYVQWMSRCIWGCDEVVGKKWQRFHGNTNVALFGRDKYASSLQSHSLLCIILQFCEAPLKSDKKWSMHPAYE